MITRLFVFLVFIVFASGCNAEKKDSSAVEPEKVIVQKEVEAAFESFSKAVSDKNVDLFISLANPDGIHLVRKFTSGTLGGRGPELSELIDPKKINEKLQFPIKDQTPYSIRIQFQELPIKSFNALSNRPLSADVDVTHFDQWEPILKVSLKGAPEVKEGDSLLLVSPRYYVYTEAQIIDDILVGGFAVFAKKDGKLQLIALIELL